MAAPAVRGDAFCQHSHHLIEVRRSDLDRGRRAGRASNNSSSVHVWLAEAATICCDRMSSGAGGISMRSSVPRGWRESTRRTRSVHPASSQTTGLSASRRPSGPSGRCAANRRRSIAAIRSGRPDQRCPTSIPKLQRSRRNDHARLAGLESLFSGEADLPREAAVMRRDGFRPQVLSRSSR